MKHSEKKECVMAEMKCALITGASSGIGFELAKLFAKDQYNLVIVGRDRAALDKCAGELRAINNIEVVPVVADLFQKEAPRNIYQEVTAKGIQIDALVNDAGQGEYGLFTDTDLDRETDLIQLNIVAYVSLTKYFLKDMLARGRGKILNVGSIAGEVPGAYHSVYHGTKAFINSWTEGLRSEVKDRGITVTLLLPGATDTDFFNKASMQESKIVDSGLSNPQEVAKDGFEALMSGDDKIVSGLKNKAMVGMSHMLPDEAATDIMKKQQEPKSKK